MPSFEKGSADPLTIGERVAWHRTRRGLSRKALAELVGRSEEWLRLLEVKGRGAERLANLVDLARALGLNDLSAFTGINIRLSGRTGVPEHPAVAEVRGALSRALLAPAQDVVPQTLDGLRRRIEQAWTGWRLSHSQYTALGSVLPDLLTDAIRMTRSVAPADRREAHELLTHAYLLGQRFAFCVGAESLAAQCTDRALLAADVADNSELLALAGWASAMTSLAAGLPDDATETAFYAGSHIRRPATADQAALRGSLLLFAAIGSARACHPADAWHYWVEAAAYAEQIPHDYQHPFTQFNGANVMVYGVALEVETGNATAAKDRAAHLDPKRIPSTNRRAHHYIDVARGNHQTGRRDEVLPALLASLAESRETILYSPDARVLVSALVRSGKPDDMELVRLARMLNIA
jgi:hypothetical protein